MRNRYVMDYRLGNIQAGEVDCRWTPAEPEGYGALLLHGATAPVQYAQHTRWASARIGPKLAENGIASVAGEMGGDTFANDTAMARVTAARTYLATTGADNSKVHLIGASMGAGVAIRWAGLNPALVASLTLLMPMVNINDIYQDNYAGLRAAIGTAWGVVYPAALPAAAHPLTQYAPAIVAEGIPVRMFYSDADAAIDVADIAAMDAALGTNDVTVEYDPDNTGHDEDTIADFGAYGDGDWAWLVEFLQENGG